MSRDGELNFLGVGENSERPGPEQGTSPRAASPISGGGCRAQARARARAQAAIWERRPAGGTRRDGSGRDWTGSALGPEEMRR